MITTFVRGAVAYMQSRWQSLVESKANIVVGITINYIANIFILPIFFGMSLAPKEYGLLTAIYTCISLIRSYGLRRFFNWYHSKDKDIYIERRL